MPDTPKSKTGKMRLLTIILACWKLESRTLEVCFCLWTHPGSDCGTFWRIPIRVFVVLAYMCVFGVYAVSCVFNHVSSKKVRMCLAYTHPRVSVTGHGIHQSSVGPWHWKFFVRSPCPETAGLCILQATCGYFDGWVEKWLHWLQRNAQLILGLCWWMLWVVGFYLDKLTLKERFCLPLATPRPMLDHHMLGSYQYMEPITWSMDAVTLCALPEITSAPRARCDCQRMAQCP